jgi:hypothetical protein
MREAAGFGKRKAWLVLVGSQFSFTGMLCGLEA